MEFKRQQQKHFMYLTIYSYCYTRLRWTGKYKKNTTYFRAEKILFYNLLKLPWLIWISLLVILKAQTYVFCLCHFKSRFCSTCLQLQQQILLLVYARVILVIRPTVFIFQNIFHTEIMISNFAPELFDLNWFAKLPKQMLSIKQFFFFHRWQQFQPDFSAAHAKHSKIWLQKLDIYQIGGSGWVSGAGSGWSAQASVSQPRPSCGWWRACSCWWWCFRVGSQFWPHHNFSSSGTPDHHSEPTWIHPHWGNSAK